MSNIAWACAKMKYVDLPLVAVLANRAAEATFKPLELASTAWAFANLAVKDSPVLSVLARQV